MRTISTYRKSGRLFILRVMAMLQPQPFEMKPISLRSLTCLHFRHSVAAYGRADHREIWRWRHGHSHANLMPARLAHLQALAIPAKEASWDLL
jgi:hypothetical protein